MASALSHALLAEHQLEAVGEGRGCSAMLGKRHRRLWDRIDRTIDEAFERLMSTPKPGRGMRNGRESAGCARSASNGRIWKS